MARFTRPRPAALNPRRRAFTLIELLVVVAIIVILIAILLPGLGRAKSLALRTRCLANLHQIGVACASYASEFDNRVPYVNQNTMANGDGEFATGGGPAASTFYGSADQAILTDGRIPAPQNKPLARYIQPKIMTLTMRGTTFQNVYTYPVFQCPADPGIFISSKAGWDWHPTVYFTTGSSYRFNSMPEDYPLDGAKPHGYWKSIWNLKINEIPSPGRMIMYSELPAQYRIWDQHAFHWHDYGASEELRVGSNGDVTTRTFTSNVLFVDAHAATINFQPNYQFDAQNHVLGEDINPAGDYAWYLSWQ